MNPKTPADLMALAIHDPRRIVETGFYVIDKSRERIPFVFNDLQNQYYEQRTARDDILKAGQIGFSTMILAILTVKFLLVPNSWSVSLSYEKKATHRLFEKVEFWLKPENMAPWLRPFLKLEYDRTGDLKNEIMNSKIYVGTAGSRAFGRGDTIHYAHLSETSRWLDAGRIATGIVRAVPLPDSGIDTWIIGETTANGVGTYHHKEWVDAIEGRSAFKPYFALWLRHNEYQIAGPPIEKYTQDEQEILKIHPGLVTDAKLRWRREMIKNLKSEDGRSKEDMFRQEFPITWQEAFLFSGTPVFDKRAMRDMLAGAKDPVARGELVGLNNTPTFVPNDEGVLKVWEKPKPGGQYVIFGDVGENHDRCVAVVLDKVTAQVVAKFKEVTNARRFGKEMQKLGYWYNTAMLAPEVNNMGQSTMDQIIEDSYPEVYFRKRLDKVTKEESDVPGWRTTEQTKGLMVGHLQNLVAEGLEIPDEDIISEMMSFVRTKTGGMEAVQGAYDDCVIATAGAYYILKLHPPVSEVSRRVKRETPGQRLKHLRSPRRR